MKNILNWIEEKKQKHEGREPRTMAQEPRNMAHGGEVIGKPGGLVEPGVEYYGKYIPKSSPKDKVVLSADGIKKIKQKIKLPVGQKWDFYDPKTNPDGGTYGVRKAKYPKLWEKARNIGKPGRAETKLIQATEAYKKIKADPDLLAEKQLHDREIYMGRREQILEDLNFKYATDKKFREAKSEYDKIQRIENPAKYKQRLSDFHAKHGNFPPGNNYKENVWRDMFRSSQKKGQTRFLLVDESGKLLTPDNFPKVDGKVKWGVNDAYKNAKFYDTKTEQFVKFDDTIKGKGVEFEKYLDQKSVGGKGAFNNAVDGYKNADDYKNLSWKNAKGEKIRLGTLMHSKLKTKTDFIKSGINIQHSDLNNAFWKNEVSTATSNMELNKLEQTLNSNLKVYKNNPIKRAKALAKFKTEIEKLPGGITKVIEDITYGIKPTAKSVISAAGKEFGATKYKDFKSMMHELNVGKSTLAYHTLKKGDIPIDNVCFKGKVKVKKASGGRIGFQSAGAVGQVCGIDFAQNKPNEFLKRISKMKGVDTFLRSAQGLKAAKGLLEMGRYWASPITLGGGEAWYSYLTYLNERGKGKSMASSINAGLWFIPGKTKRDQMMLVGYQHPTGAEELAYRQEHGVDMPVGFEGMTNDQKKQFIAMQLGQNINKQEESKMALAISDYNLSGNNPDMPVAQISPHRDLTEQQQRERNILEARSKAHLKGLREKEAEGEDLFRKYLTLVKKSEGTFAPSDEQLWAPFKKLKERTEKQMVSEFNKSLSKKYMQGDPWSGPVWSKTKSIFGMGPVQSWLGWNKTREEEKKIKKMLADKFEGRKDLYRYNINARGLGYLRGTEDLTPRHREDYFSQHPYLRPIMYQGGRAGYTGGGLTRTVAPDSGPMSQGLRSLYIDDRDY